MNTISSEASFASSGHINLQFKCLAMSDNWQYTAAMMNQDSVNSVEQSKSRIKSRINFKLREKLFQIDVFVKLPGLSSI